MAVSRIPSPRNAAVRTAAPYRVFQSSRILDDSIDHKYRETLAKTCPCSNTGSRLLALGRGWPRRPPLDVGKALVRLPLLWCPHPLRSRDVGRDTQLSVPFPIMM